MNTETINWPKIIVLILLTLLIMRLVSWGFAWALRRAFRLSPKAAAIASNLISFGIFSLWLFLDLEVGEPLDWEAVLFGAVVFGIFLSFDLLWIRRKRKEAKGAEVSRKRR